MSGQPAGSVFDRFSSRRYQTGTPEPVTPEAESHAADLLAESAPDSVSEPEQEAYRAVIIDRTGPQTRLRLHYANGMKVRMLSYAYLMEVVVTSHQWLSLVFTTSVITLKGRNLDGLLEQLQDEKVRALVCFHPGRYPQPASNEPCILAIEDHSLHSFAHEKKNGQDGH